MVKKNKVDCLQKYTDIRRIFLLCYTTKDSNLIPPPKLKYLFSTNCVDIILEDIIIIVTIIFYI